jgi:hypothetical protein
MIVSVSAPLQRGEVRRKTAIFSRAWSVLMLVYIKLVSAVKKSVQEES